MYHGIASYEVANRDGEQQLSFLKNAERIRHINLSNEQVNGLTCEQWQWIEVQVRHHALAQSLVALLAAGPGHKSLRVRSV